MITFAAWITILGATIVTGLCGVQAVSRAGDDDYHRARESAAAAAVLACVGVCALGVAGAVPGMAAVILGAAAAFTALGCVWYEQGIRTGETARLGALLSDVAAAAKIAVLEVGRQVRDRQARGDRDSGAAGGATVIPGRAERISPARDIPAARMDPALDQSPGTGGVPVIEGRVIPQFGPLLDMVAGFEPETDEDLIRFLRGMAAGLVALFEALQAAAENTGEAGAGVDPSIVQALVEAAESVGDTAHDFELVRRRFMVVYGATLEAIQGGMRLPWKARTFLTGDAA